MFSYRHAFHAGNHADVLKHTVLLAILRYLTQKDTPLTVFDTHAGAGLYRLDGDYAQTSGEAQEGYLQLISKQNRPLALVKSSQSAINIVANTGLTGDQRGGGPGPGPSGTHPANKKEVSGKPQKAAAQPISPVLQDYLDLVAGFNSGGSLRVYPGSPFIIQRLLRDRDKLKLFELHPTDSKTLFANIAQLDAGRQVAVLREDGFEGLKKFLPPPSRRALVLCDPSYEVKSDYPRVPAMIGDALQRFATGTYVVWYPIIPRPEAHDLPKKLKTLAVKAGRSWLNASLTVKSSKLTTDAAGETQRPGLPASGMFVINPPHTLKTELKETLEQLVFALGQDQHAASSLESGGA